MLCPNGQLTKGDRMERVVFNNANINPNFIGSWNLEPLDICNEIVSYFELNVSKQKKGKTIGGLNQDIKKSVDINISPDEIKLPKNQVFNSYLDALFTCHKDYILQWPFLGSFLNRVEIGSFNIQRYQAGEHFQQIHSERTSIESLHRIFAWMTYLNDVDDGGTTYFSHYDLEIKPRKGLTLIWPAEWTHAHKGNVLHSGSKYIITGWMDFCT
jgi:prolyl 4-hydroxylase